MIRVKTFYMLGISSLLLLAGCSNISSSATAPQSASAMPFAITTIANFNEPWAMTFLPDSNQALITEKAGKIILWESEGEVVEVAGVPKVAYGGQGGLGDVVLHPDFAENRMVYISYVEEGEGGFGAVVARGTLGTGADGKPALQNVQTIWKQVPKVSGRGHFGHRMAFGPDGMLYISSGERQKFDPAQDMKANLGKVVRLKDDGSVPADNPFAKDGGVTSQIWSYGHRNPLGIAFDAKGRLWEMEMGPAGGDEVNLIIKGANYGYPKVSNGSHYDGRDIPDHAPGDGFVAPKVWWNPAISPGGMMIYSGDQFKKWKGDAFIAALGGEALLRIDLDGETAAKGDQWPMGMRIREVEQGPDGTIWLLSDGTNGKLLKLTPK